LQWQRWRVVLGSGAFACASEIALDLVPCFKASSAFVESDVDVADVGFKALLLEIELLATVVDLPLQVSDLPFCCTLSESDFVTDSVQAHCNGA